MKTLTMLLLLFCFAASAQDLREAADENYRNEQWVEAASDYKKYVKKHDKDSAAWYRLAYCQYKMKEYDQSLKNYDQALSTNFFPGYTLYSKAKVYVRLKDQQRLFSTLNEANIRGFSNFKLYETDEEWSEYQKNEQFQQVVAKTRENAFPCLTTEVQRHFDFWIGKWDVLVNGQKVGVNNITLAEGGCALHERYTTARIYSGQSINYYDPLDKKWHQVWVDSGGGVLDYTEVDRSEGMIQFEADYLNSAGVLTKSRLTFTANDDGSVRQLFEASSDSGETWTASFDGLYVKQKEG